VSETAVLLDIEGTTTSISFVFDVLFPYAAANAEAFLAQHGNEPEVRAACDLITREAGTGEPVLHIVRRLMASDSKATGLKQLQGLIWKHGYESGAIKGHVFADVADCMRAWHARGRTVAIYSSGSRLAQQLIFGHSIAGDLRPCIRAYFDTTSGPKREAASYVTIARELSLPPAGIVFCTDIPAEAQAATAAGLQAVVLMRPGNAPLPANLPFPVHADLSKI
jgi:enolase-phosphatase E1